MEETVTVTKASEGPVVEFVYDGPPPLPEGHNHSEARKTAFNTGYEQGRQTGFIWGSLGTAFVVFMLVVAARFFGSEIMGWV